MIDMKLEEELINQHLQHLVKLDRNAIEVLPESYYDNIAHHWFTNIGPAKTEEYGVTAWQRLGARGIAGQLSGCYYRWARMIYRGMDASDPRMFNAVVDAFGYSMLLHCQLHIHIRYSSDPVTPRVDHETILARLWWDDDPSTPTANMGLVSLRMAYRMWRGANGG